MVLDWYEGAVGSKDVVGPLPSANLDGEEVGPYPRALVLKNGSFLACLCCGEGSSHSGLVSAGGGAVEAMDEER